MGYFADVIRDSRRAAPPAARPRFDGAAAAVSAAALPSPRAARSTAEPAAAHGSGEGVAAPLSAGPLSAAPLSAAAVPQPVHAAPPARALIQREALVSAGSAPSSAATSAAVLASGAASGPTSSVNADAAAPAPSLALPPAAAAATPVSVRERAAWSRALPGEGVRAEPSPLAHAAPPPVAAGSVHGERELAAAARGAPSAPPPRPDPSSVASSAVASQLLALETSGQLPPAPERGLAHEPVPAWLPEPHGASGQAPPRTAPGRGVRVHVGQINVVVQAPPARPEPRPSTPANTESRRFLRGL